MSHLTSNSKVVYVPVLKDLEDIVCSDSCECISFEEAVFEGQTMLQHYIDTEHKYYYVTIETRIVPIYE